MYNNHLTTFAANNDNIDNVIASQQLAYVTNNFHASFQLTHTTVDVSIILGFVWGHRAFEVAKPSSKVNSIYSEDIVSIAFVVFLILCRLKAGAVSVR
jgi:hypothetical protein